MHQKTTANIQTIKANQRGQADHGWLKSFHTFSFANFYNPKQMGFRALRVINDDTVVAGAGFGSHPHQNMEIISYVIDGVLEHQDSLGHSSIIKAGQAQYISAGSGIVHSEFNHSKQEPVHFLQIWIEPNKHNLKPVYQDVNVFDLDEKSCLRLIASETGQSGSIQIRQDARVYFGQTQADQSIHYQTQNDRGLWLHVIAGQVSVTGHDLVAGDAVGLENVTDIPIHLQAQTQFLLFDLC